MNIIGREVEMNWGTICFKGTVLNNDDDFFYKVEVTESNTEKIKVGSTKIVMEDDITGVK